MSILVTNPPGTKDGRHWIVEVQNWTGWVPAASSDIHLTRVDKYEQEEARIRRAL